jgi:hypothetical protein
MFLLQNMNGTPRHIIRYNKFIDTAKRRVDSNKRQMVMSQVQTSPSLVFIKYLLQYMSEPRYLTDDIFKVYTQDISNASAMISRKFDSTESGVKHLSDTFIANSKIEYVVPTSGIIGTEVNILDDWNKWKHVQPIRLVVNDSRELNIMPQGYSSQIVYKKDKPKYSLICIDSSALLMKYLVYLREHNIPIDNKIIDDFILKHVLSYLYDDALDVWISNYLLDVISGNDTDYSKYDSMMNMSELNNSTTETKELFDRLKNGNIRVGDIMNTKFYNGKSIYELMDILNINHSTQQNNRYVGVDLLKMSKILNIIVQMLIITFDKQQETQYIKKIIIDLDILTRKNWKLHMRSPHMTKEVYLLINKINRLKTLCL